MTKGSKILIEGLTYKRECAGYEGIAGERNGKGVEGVMRDR